MCLPLRYRVCADACVPCTGICITYGSHVWSPFSQKKKKKKTKSVCVCLYNRHTEAIFDLCDCKCTMVFMMGLHPMV
jgi:hypothetical protein